MIFFILFFCNCLLLPHTVIAEDSQYKLGVNSILTVVNETNLAEEVQLVYTNPYNTTAHVYFNSLLPWSLTRGYAEVYGLNDSFEWTPIQKDRSMLYWEKVLEPHQVGILKIRNMNYNAVGVQNGKYQITHTFFGQDYLYHNIEIRIPLKKGLDRVKIIQYDVPPNSEYLSENYHILRWDWLSSESHDYNLSVWVSVIYSYEFPWTDYLIPLGWIIIGIVITIIFEIMGKKLKKKIGLKKINPIEKKPSTKGKKSKK